MKTRYGVSYWLDRYPKARQPSCPRQRGDTSVEVAIIGGGLSGTAIAYTFAAAGVRVALLEAGRLGQGGSGSCPGLLRLEPAVPFLDLQARHGLKAARAVWQASRRAGLELASAIRRLRIRCELVPDAALRVGLDPGDARGLAREMQAMRAAGVEGTWLTAARLKRETGLEGIGAIRSAGDGYIDPYRVTLGFAQAATARKALLFERSPVTRVRAGRQGVEVHTDGGIVRAGTVVIASNYPLATFQPLRRHFALTDSYCVLTPALPSFVRREFGRSKAIVIDAHEPPHLLRRTADDRLLCLGADQPHVPPRARDKAIVNRTGQLMYELSKLYPAISGIRPEFAWDVPVAQSADGLPVIGAHRNYPRHLFACGLGHNGVGAAWLAARVLLRHHLGRPDKGDECFGFGRLLGAGR
jgi:glycine/D-amino acid oxidase-like deaminating enzyme